MDGSVIAGIAFYGGLAWLIIWWITAVVRGNRAADAQEQARVAEENARLAEQHRAAQAAQELMAAAAAATAMAHPTEPVRPWPTEPPAYAEGQGEGHMRYAAPTAPPPAREYTPPTPPTSPPAADTWATGAPAASMGPDGWGTDGAAADPFGDIGVQD